ncbi:GNAT family N-acetyltransferase [Aeromicrobium terrae]|uniref:GNAT family N-acetyltransferase n=1 Tax=Aeromicrobium terrae TaxID=2498846 RepID=UPI001E3F0F69|nr:GNAT family N-acetyltransferase [Aeromicrobium terrae]
MIREATAADVPALVEGYEWLFAAPGRRVADWDAGTAAERLHALLDSDRGTVFVADVDGEVQGFITVYLDILSVRYGQRVWVEDLAVAPDARSGGLGGALLDAAKAWAREHGAAHLELDSAFTRVDAHRFYERTEPSWDARSFGWVL